MLEPSEPDNNDSDVQIRPENFQFPKSVSEKRAKLNLWSSVFVVGCGCGFQVYSTSVVNNVQTVVQEWVNGTFFDRGHILNQVSLDTLWSVAVCATHFGAMFGCGLTRLVAERLGRRGGLMLNSVIGILGVSLAASAKQTDSYEQLVIGRFFLGISVGLGFGVGAMFLTEIPPIEVRGAAGSVQQLFIGFSDFASVTVSLPHLLGTENFWPIAFALPALPSFLQLLFLMFVCPESPRFLYLSKDNHDAARKALVWFQGSQRLSKACEELELEADCLRKNCERKLSFKSFLSKRSYRMPLLICFVVTVATMFSGISPVLAYSTDIFMAAGLPEEPAKLATVGIGVCNFLVPFFVLYLIERSGRRPLFLIMVAGCCTALIVLSVSSWFNRSNNIPWLAYFSIGCLVLFQVAYALGAPVAGILACELFETHTRSYATALMGLLLWFLGALLVLFYLPFKALIGITWSFVPFIVCLLLCLVFLIRHLPETRARNVAVLVDKFREAEPLLEN